MTRAAVAVAAQAKTQIPVIVDLEELDLVARSLFSIREVGLKLGLNLDIIAYTYPTVDGKYPTPSSPVLVLGKNLAPELPLDIPRVYGPTVKEIVFAPAGLERLRRAVRLWNMTRNNELIDPDFDYWLVEPSFVTGDSKPTGLGNLVQMTLGHEKLYVDIEVSGDIEVDQPEDTELISVAVLWPPTDQHKDPLIHVWTREALQDLECLEALFQILTGGTPLVGHNLQFDIKWLNNKIREFIQKYRIARLFKKTVIYPAHDTMIKHYVMYPGATGDHGLKDLAQKLLGAPEWEAGLKKYTVGGAHYENIPPYLLYWYNACDVYYDWSLDILLDEWLSQRPQCVQDLYHELLMPASRMMVDIESTEAGWPVDVAMLQQFERVLEPRVAKSLAKLRMMVGDPTPYISTTHAEQRKRYIAVGKALNSNHDFNPGSWQQVQKWLNAHGVPAISTAEAALEDWIEAGVPKEAEKFIRQLLKYRHEAKMLATYVRKPLRNQRGNRVRPPFRIPGTVTGRLTSWIHTIPRPTEEDLPYRAAYTVEDGEVLIGADYQQLELRIVAEICGDPQLIDDLQEGRPDFFSVLMPSAYPKLFRTLDDVWDMKADEPIRYKELRNTIKPVVHGTNYNRQAKAIAKQLNITQQEAQAIQNAYYRRYPKIRDWQERTLDFVKGTRIDPIWNLRGLWTTFGRRFQQGVLIKEKDWSVKNAALAQVPQSTGSDICLSAALDLHHNVLHLFDARIVNLHHDAIYVIAPERHAEEVSKAMEKRMRRAAKKVYTRVPFMVEVHTGKRWSEV